jgi:hypothetical protein
MTDLTPEQILISRNRLISEGFTPASPAVRVHDQLLALMAAHEVNTSEKHKLSCAFCLKADADVAILIAGPKDICICDECVHLCSVIAGRAFADKAKRAEGDAASLEAGQQLLGQVEREGA